MSGFRRHRRSRRVVATFGGFEADLLRSLASQLVELLHDEAAMPSAGADPLEELLDFSGPTTEPEDPVLRRLLPSAYPDDEEAAGEFRRYTEGGLRSTKARTAGAMVDALEEAGLPQVLETDDVEIELELDEGTAMDWLRTFTDIRLALAVRLGVTEDDEEYWASLPEDDPRGQAHDIYEWVGYLQETLVDAVSG